ncbi:hypothetical protein AALP_AAs39653U000100, partial [Arabis alpina]
LAPCNELLQCQTSIQRN